TRTEPAAWRDRGARLVREVEPAQGHAVRRHVIHGDRVSRKRRHLHGFFLADRNGAFGGDHEQLADEHTGGVGQRGGWIAAEDRRAERRRRRQRDSPCLPNLLLQQLRRTAYSAVHIRA